MRALLMSARAPLTLSAVIAAGIHLFPFRTEKLSPPAPMVLGAQAPGRVGRRRLSSRRAARQVAPSAFGAVSASVELRRRASFVAASSRRRAPAAARTRSASGGCVRNMRVRPVVVERVDRVERLGRRAALRTRRAPPRDRAGASASARSCGSQTPAAIAVGRELALRREQQVRERRGDRREHEEQRAREESADPARLDQRRREQHGERLREDVAAADVRELVRDDASSSAGGATREQARRDGERGAPGPRPTTNARGKPSSIRQSFGGATRSCAASRSIVERSSGVLGERERPRAEHPEQRPVTEPVDGDRARAARRRRRAAALRWPPISQPRRADAARRGSRRGASQALRRFARDPAAHQAL